MPCVQWDREQRPLLPFHGPLGFSFLPDGGGPFPFRDVHDRLVYMVLRLQLALWGDLHDLKIHIFLIAQAGIGGLPAPSLPVFEWQGGKEIGRASCRERVWSGVRAIAY